MTPYVPNTLPKLPRLHEGLKHSQSLPIKHLQRDLTTTPGLSHHAPPSLYLASSTASHPPPSTHTAEKIEICTYVRVPHEPHTSHDYKKPTLRHPKQPLLKLLLVVTINPNAPARTRAGGCAWRTSTASAGTSGRSTAATPSSSTPPTARCSFGRRAPATRAGGSAA